MNILYKIVILLTALSSLTLSSQAIAGEGTEEKFQEVFVTAGYSTAFGAAIGAACLAFASEPASKLSYVAVGASLGFIGGSLLGTYLVLSPVLISDEKNATEGQLLASQRRPERVVISPVYNYSNHSFAGISANLKLLEF